MGSYSNSSASSSTKVVSNFENLLKSLTPNAPLRPIPADCVQIFDELNPTPKPVNEYFLLSDIWECLEEWSAYGQGTSVTLANGDNVFHYFTPHLSALHLITNKKIHKEDTHMNGSAADAAEVRPSIKLSGKGKLKESSSRQPSNDDEEHIEACFFDSYFKFYDIKNPFKRAPLFSKIRELAQVYPKLMTLRSIDLAPASWMAIVWLPIYHIPNDGAVVKDLSTAFITFHKLSSFHEDTVVESSQPKNGMEGSKEVMDTNQNTTKMPLYPFGMAAKDLNGNVWFNGASDKEKYIDLNKAARTWVNKRNFFHQDLNDFSLHEHLRARRTQFHGYS